MISVNCGCCPTCELQSNKVKGFTPTGDRQFVFVILVADGLFLYLSGCAGGYIYLNTYPRVSVTSGLCRGVRLSGCGGSEADPDIPGIKTLKDAVHYDVWKTWKTEFRLYTTCKGFKAETHDNNDKKILP